MTTPPKTVFDRQAEWTSLDDFVSAPGAAVRIGVVYGRRRMGKSFLLRHLVDAHGGFYDQALEQEPKPARDRLARSWSTERGYPDSAAVTFGDWEQALRTVLDNPDRTRTRLVVLDEFPYLSAGAPELPSILQLIADESRSSGARGKGTRVILCGSALSVMAGLLDGTAALRGRASLELAVQPFDFRVAADYWGVRDRPDVAFHVDAILGGTPGYRDLLETVGAPDAVHDVGEWLGSGILDPSNAMFREDEYLVAEDRTLGDRALYQSIISAVANGEVTHNRIAQTIGRAVTALPRPLKALERAGFVQARPDLLKGRRPLYELTDPIVRFHHAVTRPDLARFEARQTADAWANADHRFRTHVLGPHFEHLARTWTRRFASSDTTGGRVTTVGHARLSCREHRVEHEIDVVAMDGNDVKLLGEAKFTAKERTVADVDHLDHLRRLVVAKFPGADIRLALFAGNGGFHEEVVAAARRRGDLELVDLDRLYRGA